MGSFRLQHRVRTPGRQVQQRCREGRFEACGPPGTALTSHRTPAPPGPRAAALPSVPAPTVPPAPTAPGPALTPAPSRITIFLASRTLRLSRFFFFFSPVMAPPGRCRSPAAAAAPSSLWRAGPNRTGPRCAEAEAEPEPGPGPGTGPGPAPGGERRARG